jgi:hypothetical protein
MGRSVDRLRRLSNGHRFAPMLLSARRGDTPHQRYMRRKVWLRA